MFGSTVVVRISGSDNTYLLQNIIHLTMRLRKTFCELIKLVHKDTDIPTACREYLGEWKCAWEYAVMNTFFNLNSKLPILIHPMIV